MKHLQYRIISVNRNHHNKSHQHDLSNSIKKDNSGERIKKIIKCSNAITTNWWRECKLYAAVLSSRRDSPDCDYLYVPYFFILCKTGANTKYSCSLLPSAWNQNTVSLAITCKIVEEYSEPFQTSTMDLFPKIVKRWNKLTISQIGPLQMSHRVLNRPVNWVFVTNTEKKLFVSVVFSLHV